MTMEERFKLCIGLNTFKDEKHKFKKIASCEELGFTKTLGDIGKGKSNDQLKAFARTLMKNGSILTDPLTQNYFLKGFSVDEFKAIIPKACSPKSRQKRKVSILKASLISKEFPALIDNCDFDTGDDIIALAEENIDGPLTPNSLPQEVGKGSPPSIPLKTNDDDFHPVDDYSGFFDDNEPHEPRIVEHDFLPVEDCGGFFEDYEAHEEQASIYVPLISVIKNDGAGRNTISSESCLNEVPLHSDHAFENTDDYFSCWKSFSK